MVVQSSGMNMMISYLALYIGFVFLIATAAILAIQQLSETSDSLARYRVLAEIGCDRRMIFRSLRAQVLVYFLVPLALAVCHTVCAVGVISDAVLAQLGVSVLEPALMTGVLTGIVYGAYLLVTHCQPQHLSALRLARSWVGKRGCGLVGLRRAAQIAYFESRVFSVKTAAFGRQRVSGCRASNDARLEREEVADLHVEGVGDTEVVETHAHASRLDAPDAICCRS
ncbi:MAG: hypothetical protein ACLT98_03870 [Eggerthellaceae bacterium]